MSWRGEGHRHSLARRKIKTTIKLHDRRLKNPVTVVWLQENKKGQVVKIIQDFPDKTEAEEHIQKLESSAESIDKPVRVLSVQERRVN